ncbi:hypothetical protein HCN44_005565 [Aphidius gifuensis]|uniref:DNA repair protein complementing XP-G cells n=1 Tax=Aphidius gifuensis TaxID=684658 RepID=A0A834Y161_APHGI|nr:DNA excision repair protein ERCC-5 [Aphidius gifuensis]KAF7997288.1 hypothetical protein HCN44_005565 [Aphidius gifuensis]
MGVTGLWRLIDASGKAVPVESLEGKVLAVDISIWIHQVLQGYQDKRGNAVPNAHLLGLYTRICKLLYFKIKPVFVFDGGVPLLKKNTIAARKKHKAIAANKTVQLKNDLLNNLLKHSLIKGVLGKKTGDSSDVDSSNLDVIKNDKTISDMFKLPQLPIVNNNDPDDDEENNSDDQDLPDETSPRKQQKWKGNIHNVDVTCDEFKSLPADVRFDILTDLKETRKQNSWSKLHEIPEESNEFSNYQMKRLLKRRQVQESLEAAEQEMGGKTLTIDELEKLMTEQGIDTKSRHTAYRIASDSTTRMIYINDINALKTNDENNKKNNDDDNNKPGCSKDISNNLIDSMTIISDDNKSTCNNGDDDVSSVLFNISDYDLDDEWDSDIEFIEQAVASPARKKLFGKITNNPALAYMLENTDLSQSQILELIEQSKTNINNAKKEKRKKKLLDFDDNEKCFKKSKLEYDLQTLEFVKVKEEIISDDEDDDIIKKTYVNDNNLQIENNELVISDTDSDDFVEVEDVNLNKKIEITVDENKFTDEDDIFADIFTSKPAVCTSSLNSSSSIENNDEKNDSIPDEVLKNDELLSDHIEVPVAISDENKIVITNEKENKEQDKEISSNIPEVVDEIKIIHKTPEKQIEITENINKDIENIPEASKISENLNKLSPQPSNKNDKKELLSNSINENECETPKVSNRVTKLISQLEKDQENIILNLTNENNLISMESQLESEHQSLQSNIGKFERQSTEITAQMRNDAQELLRLFGIPYVVAPQEAEAQCAYLENLSLTDGTITDDSDIWLFGGKCVYKNFFNNTKSVMEYKAKDIEHHFKLTRNELIQLALLVGSDYTVGVNGIGPVTALEVIANFPSQTDDLLRGLNNFSSWLNGGRIVVGPGKAKLRTKLKNVNIEHGFPSQAVVQAYLFPIVDESRDIFTWGKPNLVLLGDYTREKFGWTRMKFEETMTPIMKKFEEGKSQKNLLQYFKINNVPKSIEDNLSKRVQKAVEKIGKSDDVDDDDLASCNDTNNLFKKGKKGIRKSKKNDNSDEIIEQVDEKKLDIINKKIKTAEIIPQKVHDKQMALKKKLKAIEIFRKSKKGPGKKNTRSVKKVITKVANLSESSSDEN